MRGEEIMSGAQRLHDAARLEESARGRGIKISEIQVDHVSLWCALMFDRTTLMP